MTDEFIAALRAEVVAAAARENDRRRRARWRRTYARLGAVAAVVIVCVVAVIVVPSPPEAAAGVEVTRDGDDLVVRITDLETRPDEIISAIESSGLAVTVEEVPVGPSNVGRFIAAQAERSYPPELRVVDGDPSSAFVGFRIPATYDGRLNLLLGRTAAPSETWATGSDATAAGEVLACHDIIGRQVADVIDELADDDLTLRVLSLDDNAVVDGTEARSLYGEATIIRVSSNAPATATFEATSAPNRFPAFETGEGC